MTKAPQSAPDAHAVLDVWGESQQPPRTAQRYAALPTHCRMGVHGASLPRAHAGLPIGLAPARASPEPLQIQRGNCLHDGSAAMGDSAMESMGVFQLQLHKSGAWARKSLMVHGSSPAETHNHHSVNSAAQHVARARQASSISAGEQAHPSLGLGEHRSRFLTGREEPHPW